MTLKEFRTKWIEVMYQQGYGISSEYFTEDGEVYAMFFRKSNLPDIKLECWRKDLSEKEVEDGKDKT